MHKTRSTIHRRILWESRRERFSLMLADSTASSSRTQDAVQPGWALAGEVAAHRGATATILLAGAFQKFR